MSITLEFTGRPQLAISNILGEGGVNLVSAQRLVMNETKPLLIIGLHLASNPVPNAPIRACFNLRSSSFKGVPVSAPASCSFGAMRVREPFISCCVQKSALLLPDR